MLWRVHACMTFKEYDEARDFYHDCEKALPKAVSTNPGKQDEEASYAFLEECYHDQDPTLPCHILNTCSTDKV